MNWLPLVAYLFSGAFAANAVPHLISGSMGRAFQTPFAKPPGRGLSSSTVNLLWGFFNAVVSYILLSHVGQFRLQSWMHAGAFGAGALLLGIFSARHFGQFHGGSAPDHA